MLDIKPLLKDKRCKKFAAGQTINDTGSRRAMYFLLSGRVSALNGGSRSYVSPMEAFGGHEFFNGGETVTMLCTKHKTESGARKWAKKILMEA